MMAYSHTPILIVAALALLTVIAIVATAPSLSAGIDRLKLVFNTLGLAIVAAGAVAGTVLLIWGLLANSKDLIYISFIPFVAAGLTYGFITRRHRTWYGLLGFNDSRERWRSFWDETRRLWGYGPSPRAQRTRATPAGAGSTPGSGAPPGGGASHGRRPAPGGGRSYSFSFNLGGTGARLLGPLVKLAAHRLVSDRVSVFPSELYFAILLGGAGQPAQAQLASYRQQLTVRRDDGGPLALSVGTDLEFLNFDVGIPGLDGSHPVAVALRPERLEPGAYEGTITIDTGEPHLPRLLVPVTARIDRQA